MGSQPVSGERTVPGAEVAAAPTAAGLSRHLTYGRAIALIMAAGAALRLVLLARQQIWFDEDFTAVAVAHPLGEMLGIVGHDSAPPLFYIAENLARNVGNLPWNLRLVPLAAGIALIPLLATLGRRIGGDAAGLWTAAFVAALPAALQSSTSARMYGLTATLVVAATLLLWRAVERPGIGRWVAFGVAAAAAVWTAYFGAIALVGAMLAAAWLRPSRRNYATAWLTFAVATASIVPWLLFARAQLSHTGQGFWVPPLSFDSVMGAFGQVFAGPRAEAGSPWPDGLFALQVAVTVAGWLAVAALALRWRRLAPESRRAAGFCLLACSGVAILVAISVWRPLLEGRYASVMWLPLFALAGAGLALLPRRAAIALVAVAALSSASFSVTQTHPGTADLLPDVESQVGDHDLVAADANHYLRLLAQADPRVRARLHVLAGSTPPWYQGVAAYPEGAVIGAVPADVVDNRGRVLYVANPDFTPDLLPGYRVQDRRCVGDTCLTIYAPPD